jgi:hypothetical protein
VPYIQPRQRKDPSVDSKRIQHGSRYMLWTISGSSYVLTEGPASAKDQWFEDIQGSFEPWYGNLNISGRPYRSISEFRVHSTYPRY